MTTMIRTASRFNVRHLPAFIIAVFGLIVAVTMRDVLTYAWLPVIGLAIAVGFALGHRPSSLVDNWKGWVLASTVVLILVLLMGGRGMAGEFGQTVTSGSMRVAIVESVMVAIMMIAVIPSRARDLIFATITSKMEQRPTESNESVAMPTSPQTEPPVETQSTEDDTLPPKDEVVPFVDWEVPQVHCAKEHVQSNHDPTNTDGLGTLIRDTLRDYGVRVDIDDVVTGPRVIRFGLRPGYVSGQAGAKVKVSDITRLDRELALALGTPCVRINDRPELGQNTINLEVPHPNPVDVHMADVVDTTQFRTAKSYDELPIALGLDVAGEPVTLDLALAPHVLVAGATGTGKSVCLDAIITSLLVTRTPKQVRMLMIDPKRVELSRYRGIPHLARDVVTDPNDAIRALEDVVESMEYRYQRMQDAGARDLAQYNKIGTGFPRLVIIIDEIADLIMSTNGRAEHCLIRLAQLGRAAGIHLVLATQRPSVKVVTGELKANIPTRIAFATATQTDSRVILDQNGAEALTGRGDFLLSRGGISGLVRGQGMYVSEDELERMLQGWKGQTQGG